MRKTKKGAKHRPKRYTKLQRRQLKVLAKLLRGPRMEREWFERDWQNARKRREAKERE